MARSSPLKHFKVSRLEIFLSLAVLLGLVYMVYLFGLSGTGRSDPQPPRLTSAAQKSLDLILARQTELTQAVHQLLARLEELQAAPDQSKELAGLQDELDDIAKSLETLETRLGEIACLLPANKSPD
ncbi:MAG: hypothetical protein JRJ59_05925 [Deltaproteobacteria bacterium]|nr:hypothetical protein [Deltaproteobacteria bacterium]